MTGQENPHPPPRKRDHKPTEQNAPREIPRPPSRERGTAETAPEEGASGAAGTQERGGARGEGEEGEGLAAGSRI